MPENIASKSYRVLTDPSTNTWDRVSFWKKASDVKTNVVSINTLPQSGGGVRIERVDDQTMHVFGKATEAIEFGLNWNIYNNLVHWKWYAFYSGIPSPCRVGINYFKNGNYVTTLGVTSDGNGFSFQFNPDAGDQLILLVHLEPGQGDFDFAIWGNDEYQQDIFNRSLQSTVGNIKGIANSVSITEPGYILDAAAGKWLNDRLGGLTFGWGGTGQWGYWANGVFTPF